LHTNTSLHYAIELSDEILIAPLALWNVLFLITNHEALLTALEHLLTPHVQAIASAALQVSPKLDLMTPKGHKGYESEGFETIASRFA